MLRCWNCGAAEISFAAMSFDKSGLCADPAQNMKAKPNAANVAQIARALQMVTTALYSLAFTLARRRLWTLHGDFGNYAAPVAGLGGTSPVTHFAPAIPSYSAALGYASLDARSTDIECNRGTDGTPGHHCGMERHSSSRLWPHVSDGSERDFPNEKSPRFTSFQRAKRNPPQIPIVLSHPTGLGRTAPTCCPKAPPECTETCSIRTL